MNPEHNSNQNNSNQEAFATFPNGTVYAIPVVVFILVSFFLINCWMTQNYSMTKLFHPSDNGFLNFLNYPVALAWCALNLASLAACAVGVFRHFFYWDEENSSLIGVYGSIGALICGGSFDFMMYSSSTMGGKIIGSVLALIIVIGLFKESGNSSSSSYSSSSDSSSSSNGWGDDNNPFEGASGFTNRDESEMRWMRDSKVSSVRKEYHDTFNKRGRIRDK